MEQNSEPNRREREKQVPSSHEESFCIGLTAHVPSHMRKVLKKKDSAQKSLSDLTHSESPQVNSVSQKVFSLRGYRWDEVGRSRKDSSSFITGDADASCSHSQDREDDDPGMTAVGCETGACLWARDTVPNLFGPKTQTCGTQHLVPVQQCGKHQALEARQILQKHSQLSRGFNNS